MKHDMISIADNSGTLTESLPPLRSSKHLSDAQKDAIRMHVGSAANKEDRALRVDEMAKQYHVTSGVVGALCSWSKIWENKGNRVADRVTVVLENDAPVVIPASSNTSKKLSSDDIDFIADFFSTCDWQNESAMAEYRESIEELFPDLQPEDFDTLLQREKLVVCGSGMGALVKYDTPTKILWRQICIRDFVEQNTELEKRKDMVVLCLPGVECFEIPTYLELGFLPHNIVGVEAGIVQGKVDPAVIARYEANAKKYGIQTRIGMLSDILKTEKTVFDVVSLDFLGPFSHKMSREMIAPVLLNEKALFIVNVQWKRESKEMGDHFKYLSNYLHKTRNQGLSADIEKLMGRGQDIQESDSFGREEWSLSVSVFNSILWTGSFDHCLHGIPEETMLRYVQKIEEAQEAVIKINVWIGVLLDRIEAPIEELVASGYFPEKSFKNGKLVMPFKTWNTPEVLLAKIERKLYLDFSAVVGHHRKLSYTANGNGYLIPDTAFGLVTLFTNCYAKPRKCTQNRSYRYLSEVGRTPTPMLTECFVVERPNAQHREERRHVAKFMQRYAQAYIESETELLDGILSVKIDQASPDVFMHALHRLSLLMTQGLLHDQSLALVWKNSSFGNRNIQSTTKMTILRNGSEVGAIPFGKMVDVMKSTRQDDGGKQFQQKERVLIQSRPLLT